MGKEWKMEPFRCERRLCNKCDWALKGVMVDFGLADVSIMVGTRHETICLVMFGSLLHFEVGTGPWIGLSFTVFTTRTTNLTFDSQRYQLIFEGQLLQDRSDMLGKLTNWLELALSQRNSHAKKGGSIRQHSSQLPEINITVSSHPSTHSWISIQVLCPANVFFVFISISGTLELHDQMRLLKGPRITEVF